MHGHCDIDNSSIIVGVLILVAGIFSLELGISVAVFEIISGVIAANFLKIEPRAWIDFHANFGLLGLMFFAGFETDFVMLRKNWKESLRVGALSFFLPMLCIFVLCKFALGMEELASFLISIGLSTTSLALVYSVLKERHLIKGKIAQSLLSSSMVVDLLSMIALMVLFQGLSYTTIVVIVMIPLTRLIVPQIGHWLFRRYRGNQIEFQIRFILLSILSLVLVSQTSEIHVAVLAFIGGFFFSEILEHHAILEEKLKSIVFGLMAPIFFFRAGLTVKFDYISITTVYYTVLFGFVAFVSKYLGTYFAIAKNSKPSVARFSGLIFNFRLSFGIVVATFGLEKNMINPEIYFAMVAVIVLTSVVSSVLLKSVPHEL
ncbi:MAG: cation:proton antiporter [Candidatus Rifleibacteriota bacterium]